jgi:DNA-binding protein HU-beta
MKKSELIQSVAEKAGLSNAEAARAVNAVVATISEHLAEGNRVRLMSFGSFDVRTRAARTGRNPRTGAQIQIPARNTVRFRPGKNLRAVI